MVAHEDLSRGPAPAASSNRAFGLVMAGFFTLLGAWPLLRSASPRLWALGTAAAFLLAALIVPGVLTPLNRLWTGLAVVMHRVMNPIVTALIFFIAFVPIGYLLKLFKKNPLSLGFDPKAESYWIVRRPPGPPPDTMANQF